MFKLAPGPLYAENKPR